MRNIAHLAKLGCGCVQLQTPSTTPHRTHHHPQFNPTLLFGFVGFTLEDCRRSIMYHGNSFKNSSKVTPTTLWPWFQETESLTFQVVPR